MKRHDIKGGLKLPWNLCWHHRNFKVGIFHRSLTVAVLIRQSYHTEWIISWIDTLVLRQRILCGIEKCRKKS